MKHCRCCHRVLGVIRVNDWCEGCTTMMQDDVGRLQNLPPGQLVILADLFATAGALALTRAMLAMLPTEPPYEGVLQ